MSTPAHAIVCSGLPERLTGTKSHFAWERKRYRHTIQELLDAIKRAGNKLDGIFLEYATLKAEHPDWSDRDIRAAVLGGQS